MQPTPVPASAPPGSLTWGCLGEHYLTRVNGQACIRRTVDPGVMYVPPPAEVTPSWQRLTSAATEFYLYPEAEPVEDVRSLASLAEDLRHNQPATAQDPRLILLGTALRDLLAAIDRLHENNWSIGLLQPGNVLVDPGSSPTILLPDLGFVWREDSLQVPDWSKTPFAFLWDRPPAEQQALTQVEQPDSRADLATAARLINWVLTGREQKLITPPPLDKLFPGKHLRRPPRWSPLWDTLGRASRGEVESGAALQQALEGVELGTCFGVGSARPRRVGWLLAGSLLGVLLVAALTAGWLAGWQWGSNPQGSRPADENRSKEVDPLRLARFRQHLEVWKWQLATMNMANKAALVGEIHRAAPNPEISRQETDPLREQILDTWQERCRVAANLINQEQSLDHYRELAQLHRDLLYYLAQMKSLPPSPSIEEKERQCLAYIKEQVE